MVCLVVLIPTFISVFPTLVNADYTYIVLSGSMRPTIYPGDMIVVKKVTADEVAAGDIITFKYGEHIATHRLIKIEEGESGKILAVKGDANEEIDGYVPEEKLVGKVQFIIPLRYLMSPYGYILLILTPTVYLIANYLYKIIEEPVRGNRPRKRKFRLPFQSRWKRRSLRKPVLDTTSLILTLIVAASSMRLMAPHIIASNAYYSDVESISNSSFSIGRINSTIICNVSNSTIKLGENVTIYGSIIPVHKIVKVNLAYECNGSIITTKKISTEGNGVFQDIYTPSGVGNWTVTAYWNGDNDYYGATSDKIQFTVEKNE